MHGLLDEENPERVESCLKVASKLIRKNSSMTQEVSVLVCVPVRALVRALMRVLVCALVRALCVIGFLIHISSERTTLTEV